MRFALDHRLRRREERSRRSPCIPLLFKMLVRACVSCVSLAQHRGLLDRGRNPAGALDGDVEIGQERATEERREREVPVNESVIDWECVRRRREKSRTGSSAHDDGGPPRGDDARRRRSSSSGARGRSRESLRAEFKEGSKVSKNERRGRKKEATQRRSLSLSGETASLVVPSERLSPCGKCCSGCSAFESALLDWREPNSAASGEVPGAR